MYLSNVSHHSTECTVRVSPSTENTRSRIQRIVDALGIIVVGRTRITGQGGKHRRCVIAQSLQNLVIAIDDEDAFVRIGREATRGLRMRIGVGQIGMS